MIDLAIDSRLLINDETDLALQELDLLFNVTNTELIGYPDFGTNFEQFLWQLSPSVDQLHKYINQKIQTDTIYLREMDVDIDISIDNSEYTNNIYVVNIDIKNPKSGETKQRIYKLK